MENTRSIPALTKLNCRLAKQLETNTGLPAKDTYKELIAAEEDTAFVALIHGCADGKLLHLDNRPKQGRFLGECLVNAKLEEKETGNKTYWGYMTSGLLGHAHQSVAHAFNKDKNGNYYDTTLYPENVSTQFVSVKGKGLIPKGSYDYYYIKTHDRVFRWKSKFGSGLPSVVYEAEFVKSLD
jgi:hypothetical protein